MNEGKGKTRGDVVCWFVRVIRAGVRTGPRSRSSPPLAWQFRRTSWVDRDENTTTFVPGSKTGSSTLNERSPRWRLIFFVARLLPLAPFHSSTHFNQSINQSMNHMSARERADYLPR